MAEKFDTSTAGGAADKYQVCQQIIDIEKLRFEIIKNIKAVMVCPKKGLQNCFARTRFL